MISGNLRFLVSGFTGLRVLGFWASRDSGFRGFWASWDLGSRVKGCMGLRVLGFGLDGV